MTNTASRPPPSKRDIADIVAHAASKDGMVADTGDDEVNNLRAYIEDLRHAAANLEFQEAGRLRDEIRRLENDELGLGESDKTRLEW